MATGKQRRRLAANPSPIGRGRERRSRGRVRVSGGDRAGRPHPSHRWRGGPLPSPGGRGTFDHCERARLKPSPLGLGRDPDRHRHDEFAGCGFADFDAVGGDQFAGGEIEGNPGLGHPPEGHFLDGLAGGRVHDRGNNTHRAPISGARFACPVGIKMRRLG